MAVEGIQHTPGLTAADSKELLQLANVAKRLPSWLNSVRSNKNGQYLSLIRGRGMEYDESRQYMPGDDIRYLDSRTSARQGEPYTKVFRDQRERPVFICVDDRAPMHFATRGRFKRTIAANTAALIAWMAFFNGERITGLLFNEYEDWMIKSGRGRGTVMQLLRALAEPARQDSINNSDLTKSFAQPLSKIHRYIRPGSILFFISDFRGLDDRHIAEFIRLKRYCDVIPCYVFDDFDYQLPKNKAQYRLSNSLHKLTLIGGSQRLQDKFDALNQNHKEKIKDLSRALNSPIIELNTKCQPSYEIGKYFRF